MLDTMVDLQDIDYITSTETLTLNPALFIMSIRGIDYATSTETLIRAIKSSPPTWVAGEYFPTSTSDRKRPAFADRGCYLAS